MSHGTTTAYSLGCRCDECRTAYSDYYRRYRETGPRYWRGPALIAEVTTLLERGRSIEDIAAGLEMQPKSIARAFRRHGVAVPFTQRKSVHSKATGAA